MKEEKTKKEDLKKLKTSEILDYCGKTRDFDVKTDWDTKYAYEGELQEREPFRDMKRKIERQQEQIKKLEEQIEACIAVWQDTTELMERANETTVHVKDILEDIDFLPKKYMKIVTDKLKDEETLYNIWNEYTRVITHEIGPKVKTNGLLSLQKRANKILTIVVEPSE